MKARRKREKFWLWRFTFMLSWFAVLVALLLLLLCSTSRQWKHRRRCNVAYYYCATHHAMPWLEIGQRWLINHSRRSVLM